MALHQARGDQSRTPASLAPQNLLGIGSLCYQAILQAAGWAPPPRGGGGSSCNHVEAYVHPAQGLPPQPPRPAFCCSSLRGHAAWVHPGPINE